MPLLSSSAEISSAYVMGHSERERRRLACQGTVLNPFTEQLLRRAGVAPGMRVIDFGCGIGDVSLMAARLVGVHGHVTAVEVDGATLEIARQRAKDHELANITFLQGDIHTNPATATRFDAAVGRHILLHVPDPLKLLHRVFAMLRPGGVVVFQEFDFSVPWSAHPPAPRRDEVFRLLSEFIRRAANGAIGSRLFHLFLEAGFSRPDCRVEWPVDGDPDSPIYHLLAETVWGILPRAEALGLARAADFDVDTLAERMRQEARALGSCVSIAPMFGCFARKP
jgi:SAM-dependent methyltransferase